MDVLFTLNYIGIRTGLKGYKRKLSTISLRLALLDFLRYLSLGIIFFADYWLFPQLKLH